MDDELTIVLLEGLDTGDYRAWLGYEPSYRCHHLLNLELETIELLVQTKYWYEFVSGLENAACESRLLTFWRHLALNSAKPETILVCVGHVAYLDSDPAKMRREILAEAWTKWDLTQRLKFLDSALESKLDCTSWLPKLLRLSLKVKTRGATGPSLLRSHASIDRLCHLILMMETVPALMAYLAPTELEQLDLYDRILGSDDADIKSKIRCLNRASELGHAEDSWIVPIQYASILARRPLQREPWFRHRYRRLLLTALQSLDLEWDCDPYLVQKFGPMVKYDLVEDPTMADGELVAVHSEGQTVILLEGSFAFLDELDYAWCYFSLEPTLDYRLCDFLLTGYHVVSWPRGVQSDLKMVWFDLQKGYNRYVCISGPCKVTDISCTPDGWLVAIVKPGPIKPSVHIMTLDYTLAVVKVADLSLSPSHCPDRGPDVSCYLAGSSPICVAGKDGDHRIMEPGSELQQKQVKSVSRHQDIVVIEADGLVIMSSASGTRKALCPPDIELAMMRHRVRKC